MIRKRIGSAKMEYEVPDGTPLDAVIKHHGRPTVLEQHGLQLEHLVAVFNNSRSEREAAAKLQISARTMRKYLYLAGIIPSLTVRTRKSGETYKPSAVYHWIREQRGIIPRSVRTIAELSGLKEATVRRFLSRRRASAIRYIEKLGPLREVEGKQLVTTRGSRFLTQQVAQCRYKVDLYDLSVVMTIVLRSGVSVKSAMSFNEYRRLFPEQTDDTGMQGYVAPTIPADHPAPSPLSL